MNKLIDVLLFLCGGITALFWLVHTRSTLRSFGEELWWQAVRSMDKLVDFLEEIVLPFSLISRWVRGKLPLWMAWDILWSTWAPFILYKRWLGRRMVRKDRSYRGHDEFHHSLDMNVKAMLTMTKVEQKEYLADLCRRRQGQHEAAISRRASHASHH
jgi:hypothetical protein